jgi:archaellum biogenesis ATPase FlaH
VTSTSIRLRSPRLGESTPVMKNEKNVQTRMSGRAVTVRFSDVQAKQTRWLWRGYVPLGKLTLLDGDADKGKSLLTLDLAARVTTGRAFPDGSSCEAGGVVILSAEDDLEDTIRPRLDAAGADPCRVVCLAGVKASGRKAVSVSLSDLDALEEAVTMVGAKLVIVDTLTDFFGAGSLLNPQAVRGVLLPLIALANKLDFAVILIRHFTKTGKSVMSKGAGCTAIAAVSRSGLFVVKDPDAEDRRILACYKHNVNPTEPPALAFRFVSENGTGKVSWEGPADWTAEALFAASMESATAKAARRDARAFLQEFLDRGPLPTNEVIDAGKAHGIAPRTLERARREMGVRSERRGGRRGRWYLRLVESEAKPAGTADGPVVAPSTDAVTVGEREAVDPAKAKDRQNSSGGLYDPSLPPPGPPTLPRPGA